MNTLNPLQVASCMKCDGAIASARLHRSSTAHRGNSLILFNFSITEISLLPLFPCQWHTLLLRKTQNYARFQNSISEPGFGSLLSRRQCISIVEQKWLQQRWRCNCNCRWRLGGRVCGEVERPVISHLVPTHLNTTIPNCSCICVRACMHI